MRSLVSRSLLAIAIAWILVVGAAPVGAEEREGSLRANRAGRGLLDLSDPMPLATLHLQAPVNALEVLEAGDVELGLNFTLANTFARGPEHHVDAESYDLRFSGWYALTDRWYLGAQLPIHIWEGGVLDGFIEAFHDAFGLGNGDRLLFPRDIYNIDFRVDDGHWVDVPGGTALGDLVLKAHWNAWDGGRYWPALSVQALMSLPTSTSDFGKSGVDFGATLFVSKNLFRIVELYGSISGIVATDPEIGALRYSQGGYQASIGGGLAVFRPFSLVFQFTTYSALLEDRAPLDSNRNYMSVGFQWEFVRDWQFEFSFQENFSPFDNTTDVAFVFDLDVRF
jgi:hypothetical protein